LAALAQRVAGLEHTRSNLSEELVKAAAAADAAEEAGAAAAAAAAELAVLRQRHASALELMGERDEQMEELRQDLDESKAAYRDQVETLLKRLEALQPPE
jgi:chromosome segregation ATPase